jgi:hypothetical protein
MFMGGGRCDRMLVGSITTCAISAYHFQSCEFEPHSWRGLLDKIYCVKSLSVTWDRLLVLSSTNKTDRHNIIEKLLKVVLNTINQPTKCMDE